jgi:hypothetical protein
MNTFNKIEDQQTALGDEETLPIQDQLMSFKMNVGDNQWEPLTMNVSHLTTNGYCLTANNKQASITNSNSIVLCETIAVLDKRRIRIRSPIQVINTLEFSIHISYPTAIDETINDYSSSSIHWSDYVLKPGKKWCLPLNTIIQNQVNFIQVSPILK